MNILVLGASGCLGRHLIKQLLKKENNVYVLVRESTDIAKLVEMGVTQTHIWKISELPVKLSTSNIPFDWFANCACCYGRNGKSEWQVIEANYFVPLSCIQICMYAGIQNYINIDTGLPNDFNIYSKSKAQLAEMLKWYAMKKDIRVRNILLENYYAEDEPQDRFLPSVIRKMKKNEDINLTEGIQRRDFIYIDDVINALEFVLELKCDKLYLDIPLGTGEGPSIKEVILYLAKIINSNSRLRFGIVPIRDNEPDSVADISFLRDKGWRYEYSWKAGLKKIVEGD